MSLKLKTPPAEEPVTLTEAKDFIQKSDTSDDALISLLITALRKRCEGYTGRALITQTWTLWLDGFPFREKPGAPKEGIHQVPANHFDEPVPIIQVKRAPLQSVTHIKTYDLANVATVFDSSKYMVDTSSEPGRIALNSGQTWPTSLRTINAVEIEFIAGYGNAAAVEEELKTGILTWIKILMGFKAQSMESDGKAPGLLELNSKPIPAVVLAMWNPCRILNF